MPVIRVELMAGRTREQKRAFTKAVTDAFVETCGGTHQSVQVVFFDVTPDDWGVNGQLVSDVKAAGPVKAKPVDCAYSVEGSGPPVFFVHGIGARRSGWAGIVERLKSDFTCISYDLRGHGESPIGDGPFSLNELVADLEALRAKLGIERAHIIGHSLGGMIGPAYARAHPDRVLSLGLLSTAAFRTDDDSAKVKGVVQAMEEKGIPQVLDTLADRWFTDSFMRKHPERITARKRQVVETDPEVFLNVFRIYAETEMAPWIHEVKAPSLVLTGELDSGCNPRLNRQIANALPNSDLVILDGLKHAILIEASDRVAQHLTRFLKARA
jgi:4-oxalocrotonate tautomerase family enzyme